MLNHIEVIVDGSHENCVPNAGQGADAQQLFDFLDPGCHSVLVEIEQLRRLAQVILVSISAPMVSRKMDSSICSRIRRT